MDSIKLGKVIKGIECCRRGFCFACPYNDGVDGNTECKQRWADDVLALLKEQEAAVPLDKLCEWLAGNAWHLDCSDCDGEHCDCPQLHDDSGSSPEFWKTKLTKWMEENK